MVITAMNSLLLLKFVAAAIALWSIVMQDVNGNAIQFEVNSNHHSNQIPSKSYHIFNFHKFIQNSLARYGPYHQPPSTPRTVYNVHKTFEKAFCQNGIEGHGKKDGIYAHPKNCGKYIVCHGFENTTNIHQIVEVSSCEVGFFYNPKNGLCDWPSEVECFLYQGRTCYGAKGNRYGTIRATQTGYLRALKLVHVDGYLTCSKKKETYKSFWGCNTKIQEFKKKINTWVTNGLDRDGIVFPDYQTEYDGYGNYHLEGYNNLSPYVKWYKGPEKPFKAFRGGELRIWFGEDLFNIHQADNAGEHCVDVYALYSYYRPYYFFEENEVEDY